MNQPKAPAAFTVPANVAWYVVPAGRKPLVCRGPNCRRLIYFVTSPKSGSMTPIDCDVEGGKRPSETTDASQLDMLSGETAVQDGKGVSHYLTCVDRDMFSKKPPR